MFGLDLHACLRQYHFPSPPEKESPMAVTYEQIVKVLDDYQTACESTLESQDQKYVISFVVQHLKTRLKRVVERDDSMDILPDSMVNPQHLKYLINCVDRTATIIQQAAEDIEAASADMRRNRPSKFPLITQLIAEVSEISSLADLKAENDRLLIQLGKFVELASQCGWSGNDTNAADALAEWIERRKAFQTEVELQIDSLERRLAELESDLQSQIDQDITIEEKLMQ